MVKRSLTYCECGIFVIVGSFVLFCSCGENESEGPDDSGEPDNPGTDGDGGPQEQARLNLATYNTGLATGFVDYADEREPLIASQLADLSADIVCLQEVWLPEQIDTIIQATSGSFPFSYYELTSEDETDAGPTEASCNETETESLGGCVRENCSEVEPSELAGCVLEFCGTEFGSVSTECSGCLVANLGKTIDEILAACSVPGGGSMAYGGRNGLVLLSKYPFALREYFVFQSFLNRRVVLHGRTAVDGIGDVDVFCTHLTANLSAVDYAGEYASWEDERVAQIGTLLGYIEEKKAAQSLVALLGDFNCGPATSNVSGEFPQNFQLLRDGGFFDPYVDDVSHQCTWCLENPLTGGVDSGGSDSIIDHILIAEPFDAFTFGIRRILDQEVTIDGGDGPIASRLSDHYGVEVTVTFVP